MIAQIKQELEKAQFVVVGIGRELAVKEGSPEELQHLRNAYAGLKKLLAHKVYFVLTQNEDTLLFESGIPSFLAAAPYAPEPYNSEEQWKAYMNFLSGTLGHETCLLELGAGFDAMQLIRWPFEKTVEYNQKAHLVRVHRSLYMLPEGMEGRGTAVAMDAAELLVSVQDISEKACDTDF